METLSIRSQAINATGELPAHPFFPLNVVLPSYVANTIAGPTLVSIFAVGCAAIFSFTHLIIQKVRPNMTRGEELTTMWFVLCGFIHSFFEGYFAYNFLDMAGQNDLFGQLWKEYALSDSRYMTQDSFVVCMETITAVFWGPMSFICAYMIVTDHPLRHPIQMIISLGQIYGLILYYATCSFSEIIFEVVYCRPEDFYYWAYYFLCNFFWMVFPGMLLWSSCVETGKVFSQVKAAKINKKGL